MPVLRCSVAFALTVLVCVSARATAGEGRSPAPLQDDANLHDVQFVSASTGWAVGDRGVIWKTVDGGRSWRLLDSPVDCPLRSLCFLTDRIGWIAGGGVAPYTRLGYGVVLHTEDGGQTWQVLAGAEHAIRQTAPRRRISANDAGPVRGTAPPRPAFASVGPGFSDGLAVEPAPANRRGRVVRRNLPTGRADRTQRVSRRSGRLLDEYRRDLSRGVPGDPRNRRSSAPPSTAVLPALVYVKFFGLKRGVVVGEASDDFPGGVAYTPDGGQTWKPVPGPGPRVAGRGLWRAADFLNPDVGVVAGLYGRLSLVGSGKMLKPAVEDLGLRGVRGIALNRDESGWMVGDGGLVLKTDIGGVIWKAPPTPLPAKVRDLFDFHAVAAHGRSVWIAGSPGSVIWHSSDGGRNWSRQFTGQSVPIHALHFRSPDVGWAVGAMGTMLLTSDGGRHWLPLRGKDRRAAFLAINTRPRNISFPLLAKLAGDEGYRGTVLLAARTDFGPDGPSDDPIDRRLSDAVTSAGGSAGVMSWRFPVALPGLDASEKRLWDDWNARTEGRLRDVLLNSLVVQIRTWQPDVVVLDYSPQNDALAALINRAALQAVQAAGRRSDVGGRARHASGTDSRSGALDVAGLKPWTVSKVYVRLADASAGDATVSLHEVLPHTGEVTHVVADRAAAMLGAASSNPGRYPVGSATGRQTAKRQAYRAILDRTQARNAVNRDFFKGLFLRPGGEARRLLAPVDGAELKRRSRLARRQRNVQAIAERTLNDPRYAARFIAQLGKITAGMQDERAAAQLVQLAQDYRRRSQWELAEAAWIEAVTRFPRTDAALDAMQELFLLWSGAETVWHRVRQISVRRRMMVTDPSAVQRQLQRARRLLASPPLLRYAGLADSGPDPVKFLTAPDDYAYDRNRRRRQKGVLHWQEQALRMAALLRKRDPQLYLSPKIQFPLAALLRSRGAYRAAQHAWQRFQTTGGDAWKSAADGEMWMLAPRGRPPKSTGLCKRSVGRPYLDGELSDACWEQAEVIRLTPTKESHDALQREAFVMLCYDGEYLYVAGNVPNAIAPAGCDAKMSDRRRDADLSRFDRVSLHLDIDRDYTTYDTLSIDQRGWTAESCWGDATWDPQWHVAFDRDERSWRFEAAIPWKELAPAAPRRGSQWGVGVVRTVPALGVQSWTHPAGKVPRAETFGLLRFE